MKALRVIARNSSAAAYQRTKDLKEISRMLDVRYLLPAHYSPSWSSAPTRRR